MGGNDKAMLLLGGRTLAEHAAVRLGSQVSSLALNANGDAARFSFLDIEVISDADDSFSGPLAGILAGLRWAGSLPKPPQAIITVAVDTPFFPRNFAKSLLDANQIRPDTPVVAVSGGVRHPTFALWPLTLADELARHLAEGGSRKVSEFLDSHGAIDVDFAPTVPFDPFFNINTPADLTTAETLLRIRA